MPSVLTENPVTAARRMRCILITLGVLAVVAVVLGVAIGVPLSKRSTSSRDKAIQILESVPLVDGWVQFCFSCCLQSVQIYVCFRCVSFMVICEIISSPCRCRKLTPLPKRQMDAILISPHTTRWLHRTSVINHLRLSRGVVNNK